MKRFLIASLLLNLLCAPIAARVVYRKLASPPAVRAAAYTSSPSYLSRVEMLQSAPSSPGSIIMLGDSITEGGLWTEYLGSTVVNRGIGGDTVTGLRNRIADVLRSQPLRVFLLIGINDLASGKRPEVLIPEYRELVSEIRRSLPTASKLYLQSTLPVNRTLSYSQPATILEDLKTINEAIASLADGHQILFLDLRPILCDATGQLNAAYTPDGVHLNAAGYARWREVLRPLIQDQ